MKNEHACALGKLKKGVKEKPSPEKKAIILANLEKARAARWPVKPP